MSLEDRYILVTRILDQAGAKEKLARLHVLVDEVPAALRAQKEAQSAVTEAEAQQRMCETMLGTQAEGSNEAARKASLVALIQGDREWQARHSIVLEVKGALLDIEQEVERKSRQSVAIRLNLELVSSTLKALAGGE